MENIIIDGIDYAPVKTKEQKLAELEERQKYIKNGLCPVCGEELSISREYFTSDDWHDITECPKSSKHYYNKQYDSNDI